MCRLSEVQLVNWQWKQEVAAWIFNSAGAKRRRVDNGDADVCCFVRRGSLGYSGHGGGGRRLAAMNLALDLSRW